MYKQSYGETILLPLFSGLGTGLALIVAIGVQNTYLLRLAVSARLRVVAASVLVCALSDATLILAGVLGVGVIVERFPVALMVIRFVGAAFLITYGVLAARRALKPSGASMRVEDDATDDGVPLAADGQLAHPTAAAPAADGVESRTGTLTRPVVDGRGSAAPVPGMRAAVLTMLVFTWANPHVYLDTLIFLGSVANQQGLPDRWWWTAGAIAASLLWFGALGFGGRLLRPLFARPMTWRIFDGLVAVVMLAFGLALALGA